MKKRSHRRTGRKGSKRRSPSRVAIVPALSELRLGSHLVRYPDKLMYRAQAIADLLAQVLPKNGLVTELASRNPNTPPKRYVKVDGWTLAGELLGVHPIEESVEPVHGTLSRGYRATVRLERLHDSKIVGRASAICMQDEPVNPDFTDEEFALYSKTVTRATGKAFRLTYGWLMKLSGFEGTPAEELYEVEGSETASEEVAKRKIEEKLGRKFETLAHAEAALMDQRERVKREKDEAKRSVFIEWPEAHNGHRFLVKNQHLIWETGLTRIVEEACSGKWSDRDGGWYMVASAAPYFRRQLEERHIPFIERNPAHNGEIGLSTPQPEVDRAS